jgi:hypothetical protein
MAEGEIAWVAGLIDRLDKIMARSGYGADWPDPVNSLITDDVAIAGNRDLQSETDRN